MNGWNFADVWETVADTLPDAQAQVHGSRRLTWAEMDRRADGIAATLLGFGLGREDKAAHYLFNVPEYLESLFGMFKIGVAPVNTNYRYGDEELLYLWDNADAAAVVFHGVFTERIAALRGRLPKVRGWIWVDDGSGPCPEWAVPYEEAAASSASRVAPAWGRSGDDLYILYTGGTTGMPKGVLWRQEDILLSLNNASMARSYPETGDLSDVRRMLDSPGPVHMPACPLMHGTGAFTSFAALTMGGSVATLVGRTFDAKELLDTVEREKVNMMAIVGDAFAKPILAALDAEPGRWDISSLFYVTSSGVMWSEATKQGLLRHNPNMILADAFSSSEALGMGASVSTGGSAAQTAKFALTPNARVITEDGRDVVPGSGEIGMLAVGGRQPLGYYKDEKKTAATFRIIDGKRYSVPGDFATVEADGTLRVLGRGSVCINTGGEKVYPEEVEEVIKEHPAVFDAVVVGVPDDRFGEAICALVEPRPGESVEEADIAAHVKSRLAHYKAPRRVLPVESVGRAANGKVDYKRLRQEATDRIAASV